LTMHDVTSMDLVDQVDALYDRVTAVMSTRVDTARQAMDILHETRGLLASGEPRDVHTAERKINEVKMMLRRAERTGRWAQTYGWALFVYEVLFILVFVAALVLDRDLARWLKGAVWAHATAAELAELPRTVSAVYAPWNCMLWGGLGGAIGAMFSLLWHASEVGDFDKQYTLWYVVQPFSGMVLGSLVYLAIAVAVAFAAAVSGASTSGQTLNMGGYWLPALAACLAGFRQKSVFRIVEKLLPTGDAPRK